MRSTFNFIFWTIVTVFGGSASLASSEPPQEFMNSQVASEFGVNNVTTHGFTVRQFTDSYKQDKVKWEQDKSVWIFHVERIDKVASTKVQIGILFQQLSGGRAAVVKWNIDGDYLTANMITDMLMRTQADFVRAGVIKEAPPKPSKAGGPKAKPKVVEATRPPPSAAEKAQFLKLVFGSYKETGAEKPDAVLAIEDMKMGAIFQLVSKIPAIKCTATIEVEPGTASPFVAHLTSNKHKMDLEFYQKENAVEIHTKIFDGCVGECCKLNSSYEKILK